MRETLLNTLNTNIQQRTTIVESLYKPYYVYKGAGNRIISTTDLKNGFILVCRNLVHIEYFQPGFDYDFGNAEPYTHFEDGYEIPIFNLTYYLGVIIHQVDPTLIINTGTTCTRGVVCEEEPIVGGKITSFINLNDSNFTIQILDQPQASDPNLIQELEDEKFHNIEKTSQTGQKVEEIIYKTPN